MSERKKSKKAISAAAAAEKGVVRGSEEKTPENLQKALHEKESPDAAAAESAADEAAIEKRDAEAEIASLKDQLLRTVAEMENLRRRFARELEEKLKYANSNLARDLLTVADNLTRALQSLTAEARSENEQVEKFASGIEAVKRELLSAFERNNIRKIEPMGEKFNPNYHEAIFQVENTGQPPGTVVQVVQPGYVLHERLLRPAMVVVAQGEPVAGGVDTTA